MADLSLRLRARLPWWWRLYFTALKVGCRFGIRPDVSGAVARILKYTRIEVEQSNGRVRRLYLRHLEH